ncbi:MAG: lipocalin family protein [Solirubrobacteraceae bacterium]|nr:lipocalin family protein [Solirubrobacteraceae bacterium]
MSRFTQGTRRLRLLFASTLGAAAVFPAVAAAGPVTPVPSLDIQQYLGRWQQIAAIPQWYESLCERNVNANYSLTAEGTVRVINRCSGPGNFPITLEGRARILDQTTKAQLQVTFLKLGTYLFPGSDPNYVVMGLGTGYSWAVVGDPQRTSGFVLARNSALTADEKAKVLAVLAANGFDPSKLRTTPQVGGLQVAQPFNQ